MSWVGKVRIGKGRTWNFPDVFIALGIMTYNVTFLLVEFSTNTVSTNKDGHIRRIWLVGRPVCYYPIALSLQVITCQSCIYTQCLPVVVSRTTRHVLVVVLLLSFSLQPCLLQVFQNAEAVYLEVTPENRDNVRY